MNAELKVAAVTIVAMFLYLAHALTANAEADHARSVAIADQNGHLQVLEVILVGALNEARTTNGKPAISIRDARESARDALKSLEE